MAGVAGWQGSLFNRRGSCTRWKEREVELLPVRVRAGLLISARNLLGRALGAGADGSISLPAPIIINLVVSNLNRSANVIERVMGDELTATEMAIVDTELFDEKMLSLLHRSTRVITHPTRMGQTAVIARANWQLSLPRSLVEIADVLRAGVERNI